MVEEIRNEERNGGFGGGWRLDAESSEVGFRTKYMFFVSVRGTFRHWEGKIVLDDEDLERSSVEIEIDPASVSTGVGMRDWHLRTAHFFGVRRYPSLRFASKWTEAESGDRARIHGDLTIRDTTREVVLDAERVEREADRQVWIATTILDRYDYGVAMSRLMEGYGKMVDNVVEVRLRIVATR